MEVEVEVVVVVEVVVGSNLLKWRASGVAPVRGPGLKAPGSEGPQI